MKRVRIIQLLCPERHCVLATAYESPDGAEAPEMVEILLAQFEASVACGVLNPWCGLCHAGRLHAEDRPTIYRDMQEAIPHLREQEARQAATREFFKAGKN